jgi:hypothetical protein
MGLPPNSIAAHNEIHYIALIKTSFVVLDLSNPGSKLTLKIEPQPLLQCY